MTAELLLKERHQVTEHSFAEFLIWRVPKPVTGSTHEYKYSLAYVVKGECVLRYDNEAGKGDHRHIDDNEETYTFTTANNLLVAFWNDVNEWRQK